jgi:hypothetical protein
MPDRPVGVGYADDIILKTNSPYPRFIAQLETLTYDDDFRGGLKKGSTPIGVLEMLIAAHALFLQCNLDHQQ